MDPICRPVRHRWNLFPARGKPRGKRQTQQRGGRGTHYCTESSKKDFAKLSDLAFSYDAESHDLETETFLRDSAERTLSFIHITFNPFN